MDAKDTRLIETRISSREIFNGQVVHLHVDTVRLPDGSQADREVVGHSGAVVVLPLTAGGEVVLVRQFRYPVGEILLELPAGKMDPGESPLQYASRELEEETGYRAADWRQICSFYTTPGFSNELLYMLEAKGLTAGEAHPDAEEFIDTVTVPLERARNMIRSGEIRDVKTIAGILAVFALEG
jgi:ADP-ribose pyrophosphatase